jgi:hypothetical protein
MYIVYDCILVICLPEILLYIHRMSMVLANPRRGSWKVMERSWKGHGKVMERSWKGHGKVMEGHGRSWKVMEGHGRSWKVMERSWKGHGKVVATMALRRLILSI